MKKEALINKIKILIEKNEKMVEALKEELDFIDNKEKTVDDTLHVIWIKGTLNALEKTIEELNQLLKWKIGRYISQLR